MDVGELKDVLVAEAGWMQVNGELDGTLCGGALERVVSRSARFEGHALIPIAPIHGLEMVDGELGAGTTGLVHGSVIAAIDLHVHVPPTYLAKGSNLVHSLVVRLLASLRR